MFQLAGVTAKVASFNPRAEKHGEDNKLAADIKIAVVVGNSALDQFHKDLRKALYRKANTGEQQDLIEGTDGLVSVKFPRIGALSWDEEFPGYEVVLGQGLGLSEPLAITDALLKKFKFEPLEGGSVAVTFNVVFHPDQEEAGALCGLIQEDVELTLIPPSAQGKGNAPQEDLAAVA